MIHNTKSFTLIEILVVLVIIFSLSSLILFFIISLSNHNVYFVFNIGIQRQSMIGLSSMAKELRTMSQSNIGGYPIELAASTSIIFYSDLDEDGLIERIRYYLDKNTLKKGVIKPAGDPLKYDLKREKNFNVVDNVKFLNFNYYDENYVGNEVPLSYPIDISKIRIIKTILELDQGVNKPPLINSITVTPRNLRTK